MTRPTEQEIADIRNQPKIDKAYDRALTSPEMVAPPPPPKKRVRPSVGVPPMELLPSKESRTGMQEMRKGGYVRAADGCAQRGKTRGKYL